MTQPIALVLAVACMTTTAFSSEFRAVELYQIAGGESTQFGYSVDLQNNIAVIGAIDGNGSAYLYDLSLGQKLHEFVPSVSGAGFGWGLAIDGDRVIAGQYSDGVNDRLSGSAFVFDTKTGSQLHQLKSPDIETWNQFGAAADILGKIAIVGAPMAFGSNRDSGAAYVFDVSSGEFMRKLVSDERLNFGAFGAAVAIHENHAVVGAPGADAAYLFDVNTGDMLWKLHPADGFAGSLFGASVSVQGNIAVIGAPGSEAGINPGAAYVFDLVTGEMLLKLTGDSHAKRFGVDVDVFDEIAVVGASFDDERGRLSGAAYAFRLTDGHQIGKIVSGDLSGGEEFGHAISLSSKFAVIGSTPSNSAYVFAVPEPHLPPALLAFFAVLAVYTARQRYQQ